LPPDISVVLHHTGFVLNNIKILDYASSIYKLCEVKDIVDIVDNENKMVDHPLVPDEVKSYMARHNVNIHHIK
jgi:hypothetical protein